MATQQRADSMESAEPITTGRIFKTVRGRVGPFPHDPGRAPNIVPRPHVFSEGEFIRVHPIPKKAIEMGAIDPKTYHGDLIKRLLMINAIEEAPGETPMETPNFAPIGMKNHGILSAAESVVAQNRAMDAQKAADLKRLTEAQKN